jgi:peptidyl-tRNA hydrolase, PTH1 family
MPNIKLIVGLGNPGVKYAGTRHNAGYEAAGLLAGRWGREWRDEPKFEALVSRDNSDERPMLAKPQTFMNNSGVSVRELLSYYKILPGEMIVVSDDFSLPLGAVRLRKSGSDGGHNGLSSIIQHTGTSDFPRLRLGIGPVPPFMDPADFVLSRFDKAEKEEVARMVMEAADALETIAAHGWETAVSRIKLPK